ncbi:MAG TPA: OmpA family protein [Albitalea sp.]|nr:OmpA family protein [Albitalea sp.]
MKNPLTLMPLALVVLLSACQSPPSRAPAPAPAAPPVAASTPAPVVAAAAPPVTTATPPAPAPAAPPPPPPAPSVPFADAVLAAATTLFANAPLPAAGRQPVVIDPLVDGVSGIESNATRAMEERLVELMKTRYTGLSLRPFSAATVRSAPWVLIGTFTPINAAGQAGGAKDAYRVCLALADLGTGKIVSKGFARAQTDGVDITPTRFYQDSPTWRLESLTDGYVRTCQGTKAGDPIHPVYLDGILASAQISEGIAAYQAGRYREALDSYRAALEMPQGEQLRALNGVYLSLLKLRQPDAAADAFGRIVEHGLARKRIAMRFLFRPGSVGFVGDPSVAQAYPMWIGALARQAGRSDTCLELVGHTSRTGPEPLNERLSLLRAEAVRNQMIAVTPTLKNRTIANGVGSRETLVGLGTDDLRDALDRRVVFSVSGCPAPQ